MVKQDKLQNVFVSITFIAAYLIDENRFVSSLNFPNKKNAVVPPKISFN